VPEGAQNIHVQVKKFSQLVTASGGWRWVAFPSELEEPRLEIGELKVLEPL
jgi:hypothetical protein